MRGLRINAQSLFDEYEIGESEGEIDQYDVRLPMEIAAGDGLRIGFQGRSALEPSLETDRYLKQSLADRKVSRPLIREWNCVLLNSETRWVQYKGLWGVKSLLSEESGPPGPKWDRPKNWRADVSERLRWSDPLQWMTLSKKSNQ